MSKRQLPKVIQFVKSKETYHSGNNTALAQSSAGGSTKPKSETSGINALSASIQNKRPVPINVIDTKTPSTFSKQSTEDILRPGELRINAAKPVLSKEEYEKAWKEEKDPLLSKLRKLAFEVVTLKTRLKTSKDKLHDAANRVPLKINFHTETKQGNRGDKMYVSYCVVEKLILATGTATRIKDSKAVASDAALQNLFYPFLRMYDADPTFQQLEASRSCFQYPRPDPSPFHLMKSYEPEGSLSSHKETNMEAAGLKRSFEDYNRNIEEFVVIEPKVPVPDITPVHILRNSADFNHMLLEHEYFFRGESARCVLKLENEVLADVIGVSKAAAKNLAAQQALRFLKKFCWIIKVKQAHDSNYRITKNEIINEVNEKSESIPDDNLGNKLLRKMGWEGGGVGKDKSGIEEPVSLRAALNREGLGLSATRGITDEFRKKIKEVIEGYAMSDDQEDLVFSNEFRLEERQIIHKECQRLHLKSKSKGKGRERYLCISRKRSANELCQHLMSVGGETLRYLLVPPGTDGDTNFIQYMMSSVEAEKEMARQENAESMHMMGNFIGGQNEYDWDDPVNQGSFRSEMNPRIFNDEFTMSQENCINWQMPQGINFNPQMPRENNFNPQVPRGNNFNPQMPRGNNYNARMPRGNNFNQEMSQGNNFNPQMPRGNNYNARMPHGNNFNQEMSQGNNFNPQMPRGNNYNARMPHGNNFNQEISQGNNFNPQMPRGNYNPRMPHRNNFNPQMSQGNNFDPLMSQRNHFNPQMSHGNNFNPQVTQRGNYNQQISHENNFNPQMSRNNFNPQMSRGNSFNSQMPQENNFNSRISQGNDFNPGRNNMNSQLSRNDYFNRRMGQNVEYDEEEVAPWRIQRTYPLASNFQSQWND